MTKFSEKKSKKLIYSSLFLWDAKYFHFIEGVSILGRKTCIYIHYSCYQIEKAAYGLNCMHVNQTTDAVKVEKEI